MTSPVDTSVKFFNSDMGSAAPMLNAQAGSLIALLDACLITGFDTKTATSLSVASGVATLIYSGTHSAMVDSVILVSGVTGSLTALNGEQKVVSAAPGTITFATAAANGSAAGTVAFKMAPVGGWEKSFSGTNKAVYRSIAPEASGLYVRVDDTDNLVARVRGYETMTDVDTGDRMFPTDPQMSAQWSITDGKGGFWGKGTAANTNPIDWSIFADPRIFQFGAAPYTSQGGSFKTNYRLRGLVGFGDLVALRLSGDPYACALSCQTNTSWQSYGNHGAFNDNNSDYGAIFMARDYTGLGSAIRMKCLSYAYKDTGVSGGVTGSLSCGRFPSRIDGSLIYSKRYVRNYSVQSEDDNTPRCDVPGNFMIAQSGVYPQLTEGSRVIGVGPVAGRTLYCNFVGSPSSDIIGSPQAVGISLVDITGPWRS